MNLTAMDSREDGEALKARLAAGERLFALSVSQQDAEALIHDLAGTIRTFRYIASSYSATISDEDPQKAAKIAQLDDRLAELDRLKELLRPLAEEH